MNFSEEMFEISDSLSLFEKQIAMGFANHVLVGPTPAARAIVKSCRIEPEGFAAEKRMFASRKVRIRWA